MYLSSFVNMLNVLNLNLYLIPFKQKRLAQLSSQPSCLSISSWSTRVCQIHMHKTLPKKRRRQFLVNHELDIFF